jgi:hypothetical protein
MNGFARNLGGRVFRKAFELKQEFRNQLENIVLEID